MKDSEIYLKAAEAALTGFALPVLANHPALIQEADANDCWKAPGDTPEESNEFRCLLLCFMAAIAASEGR